jgi:hypothetical protein
MLSSQRWSMPFSLPKAAGMQLLLRIRNGPGALALRDARTSDSDSPRRGGPLYRPVRRLVNPSRSMHFTNGIKPDKRKSRMKAEQRSEQARLAAETGWAASRSRGRSSPTPEVRRFVAEALRSTPFLPPDFSLGLLASRRRRDAHCSAHRVVELERLR